LQEYTTLYRPPNACANVSFFPILATPLGRRPYLSINLLVNGGGGSSSCCSISSRGVVVVVVVVIVVHFPFVIFAGVPQGYVQEPLFFTTFINDLCSILKHSRYLLFADNIKIVHDVKSPNTLL
jgi:hypothetical protein